MVKIDAKLEDIFNVNIYNVKAEYFEDKLILMFINQMALWYYW